MHIDCEVHGMRMGIFFPQTFFFFFLKKNPYSSSTDPDTIYFELGGGAKDGETEFTKWAASSHHHTIGESLSSADLHHPSHLHMPVVNFAGNILFSSCRYSYHLVLLQPYSVLTVN